MEQLSGILAINKEFMNWNIARKKSFRKGLETWIIGNNLIKNLNRVFKRRVLRKWGTGNKEIILIYQDLWVFQDREKHKFRDSRNSIKLKLKKNEKEILLGHIVEKLRILNLKIFLKEVENKR